MQLGILTLDVQFLTLRIFFDDMHDSGIYSWDFLCDLYLKKDDIMEKYIKDLEKAGKSRASPFKRKKASE